MPGSAGVSSAVLREVVGLLTVAQRCPQAFVPVSGSEPLGDPSHGCFICLVPCGPGRAQEPSSCVEVQGASGCREGAVSDPDPTPLQGGPVGEGTPDPDLVWPQPPLSIRGWGWGPPVSVLRKLHTGLALVLSVVHVGSAPG